MAKVPVIKLVNLSKEFELGKVKVQALSTVNLEIYSGEFIIFFGPSGCGKSTMMSMIAGLQPPTTGKLLIRGEDLAKLNENQLSDHRRSKIGMVFQSFNLVSTMNVVENIALPLAFARIPKRRRIARAENLLEVVGMAEYKKHTPTEVSGGQQQKIAIARSLVANPWIVLADEPTGNLDSRSANEIIRLLISLNRKSKRTVILITHNPDYLEYADRIFYLKDGKVVDIKVNTKAKSTEGVKGKKQRGEKRSISEDNLFRNEEIEEKTTEIEPGTKAAKSSEEAVKENITDEEKAEEVSHKNSKEKQSWETLEKPIDLAENDNAESQEEYKDKDKKGEGLGPIKLGN